MQTARRLYVYLISGVGMGMLVAGLTILLIVLFDRVGLGGSVIGGTGDVIGQQLTLASALIVVGLPVWLIHWLAAERSVRPGRPEADLERTSDVRGLYFALALGILLAVAATGVTSVIQAIVDALLGGTDVTFSGAADGLAIALVAGAAWGYHLAIRTRDWARGPMTAGGAWLPRTYLYIATFIGLVSLLTGIVDLIDVVGRIAMGTQPDFVDPSAANWWEFPLTSALTGIIVGGGIWLGHAWYADRLVKDPGWRGDSERPARLRMAYFVAVIVATAAGTLYQLGEGMGEAITAVAGGASEDSATGIILPLLGAIPLAVAWWLHLGSMRREALTSGDEGRIDTGARLELYPMALVGLGFAAVGAAWLVGALIEALVGGGRVLSGGDIVPDQVARYAPLTILGVVLWVWAWGRVAARFDADPTGEAGSTIRRAALLIVLAVSVIAGVIAAALIFYRLFGGLFGVDQGGNAVAELALPIGILLVGSLVAAYHGTQLRRDQALRAAAQPSEPNASPATRSVELRLSGPADGDMAAVVADLRAQLPPGFELDGAPT